MNFCRIFVEPLQQFTDIARFPEKVEEGMTFQFDSFSGKNGASCCVTKLLDLHFSASSPCFEKKCYSMVEKVERQKL